MPKARGERNGRAVLTEEEVCEIKTLLGKGYPQLAIAKAFDVSQSTISRIHRLVTWKHVYPEYQGESDLT